MLMHDAAFAKKLRDALGMLRIRIRADAHKSTTDAVICLLSSGVFPLTKATCPMDNSRDHFV